jgi:laccase
MKERSSDLHSLGPASLWVFDWQIPFPTIPATALLEYPASGGSSPIMPQLPSHNDSSYRDYFEAKQFTLNNSNQLLSVPKTVDRHLFYTVGYGLASNQSCPPLLTCDGINGNRLRGSVNNITFNLPTTARRSLLEYGYLSGRGVLVSGADFNLSFPDQPDTPFDYTGPPPPRSAWYPERGTRLSAIRFNSTVQVLLSLSFLFTSPYREENCITNMVNLLPSSYSDQIIDIGICGMHIAVVDTSGHFNLGI